MMQSEGRRTTALRGPGAGGFTPPQSLAASNPCLNCGTNVQLEYCPECGQHVIEPDPTLREFLHELAEEFLHWDGKLAVTFRTLLTRPGGLTTEYLAGRRVRYISPLRLYLTCSVVFFFLSAVAPKRIITDKFGRPVEAGVVQVSASSDTSLTQMAREAQGKGIVERVWMQHMARALANPKQLQHDTVSAIPKAMFVLVPLFAAIVGLVYRDRRRRYPQHLAFALHLHAALFLALSVVLGGRFIQSVALSSAFQLLVALPLMIYAVRAARTVYGGSGREATWRMSVVSGVYFVAFLGVLFAVFALIVLAA